MSLAVRKSLVDQNHLWFITPIRQQGWSLLRPQSQKHDQNGTILSHSPVGHGNSVRTHRKQRWTWGKGLCLIWLFKIMETTVVLEYGMQCGMKLGQRFKEKSMIHPALFWILKWRIGDFKELEVLSVPKDDRGGGDWWSPWQNNRKS